ncbi:MAG TPA: protein kinase [Pseudomonadota bacterium]|nr:protein kinase [Pseudomonadota bacterium]
MDYTTADDWYQTVDAPAQAPASPLWAERPNENASLLAQRYEIKGLLGAGGAGSVFRARDLVLGEDVALKVLKRVHPHPAEAVEDLRNEVRLARRVTHRSIARVYDLVEHDGVYFLTMEFIDGISLAKRLGRGRSKQTILPLHEVITHASQIAEGLYAAHCADVVHCDLKPDNVSPVGKIDKTSHPRRETRAEVGHLHKPAKVDLRRKHAKPKNTAPQTDSRVFFVQNSVEAQKKTVCVWESQRSGSECRDSVYKRTPFLRC